MDSLKNDDLNKTQTKMQTRIEWGRWRLDLEVRPSLDICPYPDHPRYAYQVLLFEPGCEFHEFTAWLGHWVQHLQPKAWLSRQDLWNFVDASQELYARFLKEAKRSKRGAA